MDTAYWSILDVIGLLFYFVESVFPHIETAYWIYPYGVWMRGCYQVLLSDLTIRRIHQRDTVYSTSDDNYVCFYRFQYGVFTNVIRRIRILSIRRIHKGDTAYRFLYSVCIFILFTNHKIIVDRVALVFLILCRNLLKRSDETCGEMIISWNLSICWSFEAILSDCPTHLFVRKLKGRSYRANPREHLF